MSEDWTLERALNVVAKHREWWPDGPIDERGRVPGVGYWVTTILADEIERLREMERRAWAIFNPDGTLDHVEVAKFHASLRAVLRPSEDTSETEAEKEQANRERERRAILDTSPFEEVSE